jgi:hypothetical protein
MLLLFLVRSLLISWPGMLLGLGVNLKDRSPILKSLGRSTPDFWLIGTLISGLNILI